MSSSKKVCIVGSGNWGSAIAKIIGKNVTKFEQFDNTVKMYVYEEMVNGRKLTEIINQDHENVKYLPGHQLPPNVVAVPDVYDAGHDADILVFVLPHQFIKATVKPLVGKLKPTAIGISLIKGVDIKDGTINLISGLIHETLNIEMAVLMGANLAGEVADEKFCETTIACRSLDHGKMLKDLMQANYFLVTVVDDVEAVELCGALKNVVACAAGFVDGLKCGDNTKAAIIRIGLMEMMAFCKHFYPTSKSATFFESCGVADLITTCYGGRNRRVSEAFVTTGKTIQELEVEMLNGQRLQGPETAIEVNTVLKKANLESKFPLFTAVFQIVTGKIPAKELIPCLQKPLAHM